MPIIKEVVEHILHHVEAEAAESDPSQTPGVAGRARLVRNALKTLENDNRDLPVNTIMLEIHDKAPVDPDRASFRNNIMNIINRDIPRPRLAIQEWVSKKEDI